MRHSSAIGVIGVLLAIFGGRDAVLASGGLWCDAKDEALEFGVSGGLERGPGADLFNFEGNLHIHLETVPKAARDFSFGDADVSQRWLDDKALKLQLFREQMSGPCDYVNLVIETKAIDEGVYAGTYVLTVALPTAARGGEEATVEARGTVKCGAE